MILDDLANSAHYENLHPLFPQAFAHLRRLAAEPELPEGRIELDGDLIYAMSGNSTGKPRERARTETHRRYIDIQYVVRGTDLIGWMPVSGCQQSEGYNDVKDVEFYPDRPDVWFRLESGQFAVFLPHDAHAPMANEGQPVQKIVVKVAV
jgi:biofilm protein TabA